MAEQLLKLPVQAQQVEQEAAGSEVHEQLLGNYVTPVPAQMRRGPRWFAGSADAKPR